MTLDEIVAKAIPFLSDDCRLVRGRKEYLRKQTRDRIEKWQEYQLSQAITDLVTPEVAVEIFNRCKRTVFVNGQKV